MRIRSLLLTLGLFFAVAHISALTVTVVHNDLDYIQIDVMDLHLPGAVSVGASSYISFDGVVAFGTLAPIDFPRLPGVDSFLITPPYYYFFSPPRYGSLGGFNASGFTYGYGAPDAGASFLLLCISLAVICLLRVTVRRPGSPR
jgi:hypothetical protein